MHTCKDAIPLHNITLGTLFFVTCIKLKILILDHYLARPINSMRKKVMRWKAYNICWAS